MERTRRREGEDKEVTERLQSRGYKSLRRSVYEILKKVPEGKVTTYKAVAEALGRPKASRVIGNILKSNPNPVIVPCHRVIRSDGRIGGYAYGTHIKEKLLEAEGVKIKDGYIESDNIIRDLTL